MSLFKICSEGCIGGPARWNGHHPMCPNAPSEPIVDESEKEVCPICEKVECDPDCEAYEDGY